MMSATKYRIVDEPQPGALARVGVNPMWPMLAHMFAGSWFAWIWFLINGYALGSPTRKREVMVVVVGFVGVVLLGIGIGMLFDAGYWTQNLWIGILIVTLWKLGISYWLFASQSRTFELYEYFGGVARNGLVGMIAGFILKPWVASLVPHRLWQLVVS